MVKITVNFFWENQKVLSDSVELNDAIIGDRAWITSALVDFFQEIWNLDINDYTLRDILILDSVIKVHLKSVEDFRQIQLYKLS